jgi:chromosomal replication initiation ATPase DnaA
MLRDYQQRTITDLYAWFEAGNEGNPCLVLPTGSGKSHIIAALCKDALQSWPETRVLMLTHVNYRTGAMFNMKAVTAYTSSVLSVLGLVQGMARLM